MRPLREAKAQVLNSLAGRRHQMLTLLVSEKNRLGTASVAVRPRIEARIIWLKQEFSVFQSTEKCAVLVGSRFGCSWG